jgi:hypothetical protein
MVWTISETQRTVHSFHLPRAAVQVVATIGAGHDAASGESAPAPVAVIGAVTDEVFTVHPRHVEEAEFEL